MLGINVSMCELLYICCVLDFVRIEQEMSEIFRQIGRGNPIGNECRHSNGKVGGRELCTINVIIDGCPASCQSTQRRHYAQQ